MNSEIGNTRITEYLLRDWRWVQLRHELSQRNMLRAER